MFYIFFPRIMPGVYIDILVPYKAFVWLPRFLIIYKWFTCSTISGTKLYLIFYWYSLLASGHCVYICNPSISYAGKVQFQLLVIMFSVNHFYLTHWIRPGKFKIPSEVRNLFYFSLFLDLKEKCILLIINFIALLPL